MASDLFDVPKELEYDFEVDLRCVLEGKIIIVIICVTLTGLSL